MCGYATALKKTYYLSGNPILWYVVFEMLYKGCIKSYDYSLIDLELIMKKRITYLGGFNLPDKNAAAHRVLANAKILRELGYEVILVGLSQNLKKNESFTYQGFECVNLPYPTHFWGWVRLLTSIKQYIPYICKDTFAVIAYNHPAIALKRLLTYNKQRGIKTISDCTEWYEPVGGVFYRLLKGYDTNLRMNRIHPRMDGIITISRFLNDFYDSKNVKTVLLPPLVDINDSKWEKTGYNGHDCVFLLYAGSPEGEKGEKDRLDFVINALKKISKLGYTFTFNIVGITEEQYRGLYVKEESTTIPSFIKFWGRLPHNKVIEMLKNADFQIFLRENHLANRAGFPTKFAETISAGTIVLTNASSNIKDFMIEGINSFELDISSEDKLVSSLKTPLSLSKEALLSLKSSIDTRMFDYRNFIDDMRAFIKCL